MYDMDNDGVISKDELCAFLSLMIGGNISNEQVNNMSNHVKNRKQQDNFTYVS